MKLYLPIVAPFTYREQPGRWKFVLTSDLVIYFPSKFFGDHRFMDKTEQPWVDIQGRKWTIYRDYAWDGASCAINFTTTLAASAWHDACGQFRHLPCLQPIITGGEWNRLFADIIRSQGAPRIAALYHFGLILGNPFYSALGKLIGHKPTGTCSLHPQPPAKTEN